MVEDIIKTDLQKLQDDNAVFEKELVKAREMRAERQKIEAEKMLAGTSGAVVEVVPVKEETAKEYSEKVMKGEIKAK